MAATAILAPLQAPSHHHEVLLDLCGQGPITKLQVEWEGAAPCVDDVVGPHTPIHEADRHEQLTARRMLTAMFPSMDLEVITTVLSWNGNDVELAASSILDMWTEGEATTPDDGALAKVLQRSLEVEVTTEEQLQSDEQTARDLQASWEAEEQEEEELARRIAESSTRDHRNDNGSPPAPLASQTSRGKMLAFLRARGTGCTRFTARLLDDDLPREISPSVGETALLAGYAPPPPPPMTSEETATPLPANTQPLSTATAPEGRYDSRVQRAKRANLSRKLSSDGTALLLSQQGSSQSVCSLNPAGGAQEDWPPAIV